MMPVLVDLASAQFRLSGRDFEPTDLAWHLATPEQRTGYWNQIALLARDRKYAELNSGTGVDGNQLPPRKKPRHDHANGRVLVPHYSDSRFRTELRWGATADGAILYWKSPWGKVVGYHARGEVRGAPVRNVIGLTARSQQQVYQQAQKWWAGQVESRRFGAGTTMQGPSPGRIGPVAGWTSSPPSRKPDSPFAGSMPARQRPNVAAPAIPRNAQAYRIEQQLWPLWDAAGRRRTTPAAIDAAVAGLARATLATLDEVLVRFGVDSADLPATKPEALRMLRTILLDRLRSGLVT